MSHRGVSTTAVNKEAGFWSLGFYGQWPNRPFLKRALFSHRNKTIKGKTFQAKIVAQVCLVLVYFRRPTEGYIVQAFYSHLVFPKSMRPLKQSVPCQSSQVFWFSFSALSYLNVQTHPRTELFLTKPASHLLGIFIHSTPHDFRLHLVEHKPSFWPKPALGRESRWVNTAMTSESSNEMVLVSTICSLEFILKELIFSH